MGTLMGKQASEAEAGPIRDRINGRHHGAGVAFKDTDGQSMFALGGKKVRYRTVPLQVAHLQQTMSVICTLTLLDSWLLNAH
jgi:hypothetical protein